MVSLSVTFGAGMSSSVHASGDSTETKPCRLDMATIGSTTLGLLSTNLSILRALLFALSGGISCWS